MTSSHNFAARAAILFLISVLALTEASAFGASSARNHRGGANLEASSGAAVSDTAIIESSCSYSIAPDAVAAGPQLATGAVAVTAGSGCDWTATTNDDWIVLTGGLVGSGNGIVTYAIEENDTGSLRSGTVTIAGLTFTINQLALQPLAVLTPPLPFAVMENFYFQAFSGAGGIGPYSWAVGSGSLPEGLALDSTGRLFGTPTVVGAFDFTVEITDHGGRKAHAAYSIEVFGPSLNVTTNILGPAVTGTLYNEKLFATGGLAPYHWSVTIGELPSGLSLDSAAGIISGVPDLSGNFRFTVTVRDARSSTATRVLQAFVYGPNDVPSISNVKYKNSTKVIVNGAHFDLQANLFIDGVKVEPRFSSDSQFIVKPITLSPGAHQFRIINRNGLSSSVMTTSVQ